LSEHQQGREAVRKTTEGLIKQGMRPDLARRHARDLARRNDDTRDGRKARPTQHEREAPRGNNGR